MHFLVHHAFHSKGFAEFAEVLCIELVVCKPLKCLAYLKYITIECMDETVDGERSCTQALSARLKAELVSDVRRAFRWARDRYSLMRGMLRADDKTALLCCLGKARLFLRAFALMGDSRKTVFGGSRIGP